jgi:hypothetical protein
MANAYFSVPDIIDIAKASVAFATTDILKGTLFSPRINPKLAVIIDMELKAVEWAYSQTPSYTDIQFTANYLYDLCGLYALRARNASGGGIPITPVAPPTEDCTGLELITYINFESDGVTVINTDWANKRLFIFWNNIPKYIFPPDEGGIDWEYVAGGGFKILIPGFDATVGGPNEDVQMVVAIGCFNPGGIIFPITGGEFQQATFSGDGFTTEFSIAHGITGTPNFVIQPVGDDAAGEYSVTANATYIIITYNVAPPTGTDNVVFDWNANLP